MVTCMVPLGNGQAADDWGNFLDVWDILRIISQGSSPNHIGMYLSCLQYDDLPVLLNLNSVLIGPPVSFLLPRLSSRNLFSSLPFASLPFPIHKFSFLFFNSSPKCDEQRPILLKKGHNLRKMHILEFCIGKPTPVRKVIFSSL